MDIVSRLKTYMDHLGLPSTQFADMASIPRPTLSQILNGRNKKISNELISKLHNAFPSLNIVWLLFGDGDMEENASHESKTTIQNTIEFESPMPPPPAPKNPVKNEKENTADELKLPDEIINVQRHALTPQDTNKKIQTIIVFYTDNSFEIFTPSQK